MLTVKNIALTIRLKMSALRPSVRKIARIEIVALADEELILKNSILQHSFR